MTSDDRIEAVGGAPWRARVHGRDSTFAGAGILVDRWHVLTCTPVVARATGADANGTAPAGELVIDFPFWRPPGSPRWRVRASVPGYGWAPRDSAGRAAWLCCCCCCSSPHLLS